MEQTGLTIFERGAAIDYDRSGIHGLETSLEHQDSIAENDTGRTAMGLWLTQKTCSGPSDIVLAAGVSATVSTSLLDCAIFTNTRMIGKACFQKTNVFVLTDATAFIFSLFGRDFVQKIR